MNGVFLLSFLGVVFINVIIPMLVLLSIGALLQRKFTFNLRSLSNLLTYCFMPAAVFVNIYNARVELHVLGEMLGYVILFSLMLIIVSTLFSKLLRLNKGQSAVFKNSIVLINAGNYGLPVSQLVFHSNPLGVSIQIMIIIYQNLLTFSYGVFNLVSATKTGLAIFRALFRLPIIHAVIIGILLNYFQMPIPYFLLLPIEHLASAFVAVALITLGAQLTQIEVKSLFGKVIIASSFGRLVIGPVVALLLIFAMGIEGIVAQSLFIASSFPTSRNSATLALDYEIEPSLAAQIVLVTTLLSSFTVGVVIYLSTLLF